MEAGLAQEADNRGSLLLVEDDRLVQKVAIRVLERAGYDVEHAASVREALDRVAAGFVPDLLVTDVMLPDGNGKRLADELAESAGALPVLFISGYPDEVIAEFGLDGPRMEFLQKPFSPADLRQSVGALLGDD